MSYLLRGCESWDILSVISPLLQERGLVFMQTHVPRYVLPDSKGCVHFFLCKIQVFRRFCLDIQYGEIHHLTTSGVGNHWGAGRL